MDTKTPDSGALGWILAYGSVLGALAYGMGMAEEFQYLVRLGLARDFVVVSPRHFALGGLLLLGTFWPLVFVVQRLSVRKDGMPSGGTFLVLLLCCIVEFAFALGLTMLAHVGVLRAVEVAIFALVACATVGIVITAGVFRGGNIWWQFVGLILILSSLHSVASSVANQQWWVVTHGGEDKVRLLITSDAVPGARQLGLNFPNWKAGENSAELSDEIEVVYEGERMYVLRVNNKLVHLSKEKILGSVP